MFAFRFPCTRAHTHGLERLVHELSLGKGHPKLVEGSVVFAVAFVDEAVSELIASLLQVLPDQLCAVHIVFIEKSLIFYLFFFFFFPEP